MQNMTFFFSFFLSQRESYLHKKTYKKKKESAGQKKRRKLPGGLNECSRKSRGSSDKQVYEGERVKSTLASHSSPGLMVKIDCGTSLEAQVVNSLQT